MGNLLNLLRGVALSQQTKTQVIAFDREHEKLIAQVQRLQAEKLALEAEVNPLKRQIDRLQEKLDQQSAEMERSVRAKAQADLDPVAAELLEIIANNPGFVTGNILDRVSVSRAKFEFHLDVLRTRGLVKLVAATSRGEQHHATPDGRKYLHDRGRL